METHRFDFGVIKRLNLLVIKAKITSCKTIPKIIAQDTIKILLSSVLALEIEVPRTDIQKIIFPGFSPII